MNHKSRGSYAFILEEGAAVNKWMVSSVALSAFHLYLEQAQIKLEFI
jgi:hypothetical protein